MGGGDFLFEEHFAPWYTDQLTGPWENATIGLSAALAAQRGDYSLNLPPEYAAAVEAHRNEIRSGEDLRRVINEAHLRR